MMMATWSGESSETAPGRDTGSGNDIFGFFGSVKPT
jgi:hypothetical protein